MSNYLEGWIFSRSKTETLPEISDNSLRKALVVVLLIGGDFRKKTSRNEKRMEVERLKHSGNYDLWLKEKVKKNRKYIPLPKPKEFQYKAISVKVSQSTKVKRFPKIRRGRDPVKLAAYKERCKEQSRKRYKLQMLDAEFRLKKLEKNRRTAAKAKSLGRLNKYARKQRLRPEVRIVESLRRRLNAAMRGELKDDSALDLLGCTLLEFMTHLRFNFKEGMSFDNYGFGEGKWVIDHVKPIAAHDVMVPEQLRAAFHWSNTQPLWWKENNCKKSLHDGVHWGHYSHYKSCKVPTVSPPST